MSDRLLVDLAADDRVSVSTWLDGELPSRAEGWLAELEWPLDAAALEDLRWYLEDYLRAPFGVYESRGPEVAARLAPWGDAVFAAVFGSGQARDAYQWIQGRSGPLEVVFRSASPELLALPWELMRDPARGVPLALDVGMSRSLPTAELGASLEVPGGKPRVLMVSSRPVGAGDVGFQMITRPLLDRLEALRGPVELVVLRPPTLDALAETLTTAERDGEPFHVVHFDGHGALASPRPAGSDMDRMYSGRLSDGLLVLQGLRGGAEPVSASRIAQVLARARVPIVMINACQSGAVSKELEAAVATRLLRGGVASVVATGYSMDAVAAAEFIVTFYEHLFAGETVSDAVSAGRRQLYLYDKRPSPKGETSLADWLAPVHYMRREVRFPGLVTARPPDKRPLEEELSQLRSRTENVAERVLAPVITFVGRDALIYELDSAAQLEQTVLLYGPTGIGKTELAKAFGRWWRDTGGLERSEWVFWHSFEPGLASFRLDGVVTEIGITVFGSDFSQLDNEQRKSMVVRFLRDHRALLIWDSFETTWSMPDPVGATPPLEEAERHQVREFLSSLTTEGKSSVIITSRTSEDWLGPIRRFSVGGLLPDEAAKYADVLLAPYPAAAPRRSERAFGELMEWLDGHPLSMRLVLPRIETTDPQELLAGLRGTAPLPGLDLAEPDRATSLRASLDQSFIALNPETRRLTIVACLFQGTADADVLAAFSLVDGVPEQFRGITREIWAVTLDATTATGLMTRLGGGMYRIHPALPAYLSALWRREEPDYEQQRTAATRALLSAYAAFGAWLDQQIDSGNANLAYTVIGLHQRTMSNLLGFALDGRYWTQAQAIAQPLNDYWNQKAQYTEADMWTERVRSAVEDANGIAPDLDSPAGELWLFFVGSQAYRQATTGQLNAAERNYGQIEEMLLTLPASPMRQSRLAATRHHLGTVSQRRGRFDEAEDWYRKSLAIDEDLKDLPGLADSYYQLGMLAQRRGQLDNAETWYRRSLVIGEELGDRPHIALCYYRLGIIAQRRGRLDEAADRYTRSLAVEDELGNRSGRANNYDKLGTLAQERGQLDDAENWYRRSLAIKEELGDRYHMADSYHQLGMVAQLRGRFDEAENWYRKALTIYEDLRYPPGLANIYGQLGLLAEQRKLPREALEWMVQSVTQLDQFPDRMTGPGLDHLARMTTQFGMSALEASWLEVTGSPLPKAVRDYVNMRKLRANEQDGDDDNRNLR